MSPSRTLVTTDATPSGDRTGVEWRLPLDKRLDDGIGPEIRDVLDEAPSWPVQWGAVAMLAVLATLTCLAALIHAPEIVSGAVSLTTASAPAVIAPSINGRLERIAAKDRVRVQRGAPIALLESAARFEDVEQLRAWATRADPATAALNERPIIAPPTGLILGSAQDSYTSLCAAVRAFNDEITNDFGAAALPAVRSQITQQDALIRAIVSSRSLADTATQFATRAAARKRAIGAAGFVSEAEQDEAQASEIQTRMSAAAIDVSLRTARGRLEELRGTLLSLMENRRSIVLGRRESVIARVEELGRLLREWDLTYVLRAPVSGEVSYLTFAQPHATVRAGEELFGVIPEATEMVAETMLREEGSGRVHPGQHARLSFVSLPVRDYGYVDGIVRNISPLPHDSVLLVHIVLPHGLRTSYGRTLRFQQRMLGIAEIVTGDATVLQRLLNGTRLLLDQH